MTSSDIPEKSADAPAAGRAPEAASEPDADRLARRQERRGRKAGRTGAASRTERKAARKRARSEAGDQATGKPKAKQSGSEPESDGVAAAKRKRRGKSDRAKRANGGDGKAARRAARKQARRAKAKEDAKPADAKKPDPGLPDVSAESAKEDSLQKPERDAEQDEAGLIAFAADASTDEAGSGGKRKRRGKADRAKRASGGDDKAAKRVARKQRKGKGKSGETKDSNTDLLDVSAESAEEELLEQAAHDDERDSPERVAIASGADRAAGVAGPLTVALVAPDPEWREPFLAKLEEELKPCEVKFTAGAADFVIDFGARETGAMAANGRKATVLVDWPAGDATGSQERAKVAGTSRALLLPLEPLVRRYGREAMLDEKGGLTSAGTGVLASIVANLVRPAHPNAAPPPAADLAEAFALCENAAELLKNLDWKDTAPPRSLKVSCRPETVENFLDGKLRLSGKEPPLEYADLFFSKRKLPAPAEHALYSLDFIAQVLTYWFAKANRVSSKAVTQIDAVVKARGITASALLGTIGATLARLTSNRGDFREAAWQARTVQRRAVAFELFLLCCRMAALRKIRFEQAHCGPVFRGLLNLLERLRPTALPVGSSTAVVELSLLAGLALPLRKMHYGSRLLDQVMEWLCAGQLTPGMSADGVWHEGFAQHGSVLGTLSILTGDLRQADISVRPIAAAMNGLARFAGALLGEGGALAPIDELPGATYLQLQRTARAIIQKSAAATNLVKQDRSRTASLFQDSGYFISRSEEQDDRPCSHLVVHARAAAHGGPSLSFSLGGKPLLVGGGTIDAQASREIRRVSRLDPAAHNAIRIDRQTYVAAGNPDSAAIRIENSWEQPLWAAVRMLDDTFEAAWLARTIIHLKPGHALIVVDELQAQDHDAQFEQFWHLAPSLQLPPHTGSCLAFPWAEGGVLNATFDADAAPVLSRGGTGAIGWTSPSAHSVAANPYIVRERRCARGLMASFFQWGQRPRRFEIAADGEFESWSVTVKTSGAAVCFTFGAGDLQLVE